MRRTLVRLRALLRRRAMERELDDELRYHIENEAERLVARGLSVADAQLAARRAFGNVGQHKDAMRDSWGWRWLDELGQDARYAFRAFSRTPLFATAIVLTIGLGLGLNATAFTIFDAYVLRPAAVRDPGSLYSVAWVDRAGRSHRFAWPDLDELRSPDGPFGDVFGFHMLYTRMDSQPAVGQLVSGNYFRMLGVGPALGRTLHAGDEAPAGGAVVVLSHRAWQARFGGDSAILGRTIHLRGRELSVVGVARAGFNGLGDTPLDFWAPVTMVDALSDAAPLFDGARREGLSVVARLRPGVSADQARSWLGTWAAGHTSMRRERDRAAGAWIESRATSVPLSADVVLLFSPLAAAFALVMVISCANVASMMLARGMAREREVGIRLSLGATRARLVRQLLTESLVLAVPAAAMGFLISRLAVEGGTRLMFATLPAELGPYIRLAPLSADARVAAFMVAGAVASALLFGLVPSLQATRLRVVQPSRGGGDVEPRSVRLRSALIVGQITVCVVLLVCAGVLLRGARRLQTLDVGIATRDVVEIGARDPVRSKLLAHLRAQPYVRDVAAAAWPPLDGRFPSVGVATDSGRRVQRAYYDLVSSSYFRILDIPVVRGRTFTEVEERAGAPVAIVSEATAAKLWPGRDAIGEELRLAGDSAIGDGAHSPTQRSTRVIGVVRDVVLGVLIDGTSEPVVYYPVDVNRPGSALLARVAGNPTLAARELDASAMRDVPGGIEELHPLAVFRAGQVYPFRAAYWVSGALGAIALVLTLTGIYGVIGYVVAQRRRELGIRMALGATAHAIIGLVLRQSLRLAALGLALGALVALAVSRLFAANIVMIDTFDFAAYGGGLAVVLGSCMLAAYLPSRRAAQVSPTEALQAD